MAQELKSINLVAPGFKGINTEDAPLSQDPSFAEVADNAVIDKRGRVAARKGLSVLTNAAYEYVIVDSTTGFQTDETITGGTSAATATIKQIYSGTVFLIENTRSGTFTASETLTGSISAATATYTSTNVSTSLGSSTLSSIKEFRDDAGNTKIFSVGNNKILSGTTTLVDESPSSYTITIDRWKIVNFNDKAYFFQRGYEPLVYDSASEAVAKLSTVAGAAGVTSAMYGNEVLAAYGRLWTADFSTDKSTVYWSDLLTGHDWSGGTSGSIDISKVWPDGYDEIVALAAHNNLLIILGKRSIVVYSGADAPATMTLSDTVAGVGCVDRDTVQYTGVDVLFLSQTGLKSFGRTIQEKSMPISSLSGTITKDIINLLTYPSESFYSVYYPEENFYLLTFITQDITLCFDVRGTIENGAYRVTRWPGTGFTCYERKNNGDLLIGSSVGIGTYTGHQDNGSTYRFKYFSPDLSFGDPSKIKFLKKIRPTIVGGSNATVFMKWTYDFGSAYSSAILTLSSQATAEYGVDEFNIGQFSDGELTSRTAVNTNGSGGTLTIGMEADINGEQLSLQEINVLALVGKTI
jgi:hypothetical protein